MDLCFEKKIIFGITNKKYTNLNAVSVYASFKLWFRVDTPPN